MIWSWSHTEEAYQTVKQNIYNLDNYTLRLAWAEIKTYEICIAQENLLRNLLCEDYVEEEEITCFFTYFNHDIFNRILEYTEDQDPLFLCKEVWEFTQQHRKCSAGGFLAYITPYNNTLSVPFS